MAFEPIMTQEALDAIITDRLKREREKTAEKYADYDSLKTKVGEYEKQLTGLNKQLETLGEKDKEIESLKEANQKYETDSVKTRLAHEAGLPYGSTKYISGNTEEEIKASIADFQNFTKTIAPVAPLASSEPKQSTGSATMNALKKLNESLHKE